MSFLKNIVNEVDYIYEKSLLIHEQKTYVLVKKDNCKLLATDDKDFRRTNDGEKCAPLTSENVSILRSKFPNFSPQPIPKNRRSFGIGDRLGNATAAHLQVIEDYDVFPVIAQQSLRELSLTNRTYEDIINSAAVSCFEVGYFDGYAADGDHLKNISDILDALKLGCTMITIDCSDITRDEAIYTNSDGIAYWNSLSQFVQESLLSIKDSYEQFSGTSVPHEDFIKEIWAYYDSLRFLNDIHTEVNKKGYTNINFEISVDETSSPTSFFAHWLFGYSLKKAQFPVFSIAPRFVGEFQKGIDYIGSISEFEKNMKAHYKISKYFDYRLSFHSGSDKFSVFNVIGDNIENPYHIKISGTNWLEALRLVSVKDPVLFRKIYTISYDNLDKAKEIYEINAKSSDVINPSELSEESFNKLLDNNSYRQVLHVGYGFVLNNPHIDKSLRELLSNEEQLYYQFLMNHFEKHLKELRVPRV